MRLLPLRWTTTTPTASRGDGGSGDGDFHDVGGDDFDDVGGDDFADDRVAGDDFGSGGVSDVDGRGCGGGIGGWGPPNGVERKRRKRLGTQWRRGESPPPPPNQKSADEEEEKKEDDAKDGGDEDAGLDILRGAAESWKECERKHKFWWDLNPW